MKLLNYLIQIRDFFYVSKISSYIFSLIIRLILLLSIASILVLKGAKISGFEIIKPFFTIIELSTICVLFLEFLLNHITFAAVVIKQRNFSLKILLNHLSASFFIVNIIAMIPFYLMPYPYTLLVLISRMLLIGRFSKKIMELINVVAKSIYELSWFFTIFLFFLFISSISIYIAENPYNKQFKTIFDAFWWSVVTATTVGYGDIVPKTETGRLIASFLMIFGIVSIAMLTSIITSAFTRRIIETKLNKEELMQKEIDNLLNHFIICGFGKISSLVAHNLATNNIDFVIVEKDKEKAKAAMDIGYLTICADAAEEATLIKAGILRARGLAILTNSDAENLYILMSARDINKDIFAIARVNARENEEDAIKRLKKLNAETISPYHISATRAVRMILAPNAADVLFSIAGMKQSIEIDEIMIPKNSPYENKMIKDTNIRKHYNLMIIALIEEFFNDQTQSMDRKMKFNPSGEDVIKTGTILICVGLGGDLQKFKKDMASIA